MLIFDTALVWFRRDLRNFDHAALYHALTQSRRVFCLFRFDPVMQSEKFDPGCTFIRRYLPGTIGLAGITLGDNYPAPVIQHEIARKCTPERYAVVKKAA